MKICVYGAASDNSQSFVSAARKIGRIIVQGGHSLTYDWATTEISADIKSMWYRFSRREDDYCIECSEDGIRFRQMRICHMLEGTGKIKFGVYVCSPEDLSFKAVFTDMKLMKCQWKAHDGQKPDGISKVRQFRFKKR